MRGHTAEHRVPTGACSLCMSAYWAKYFEENKVELRQRRREYDRRRRSAGASNSPQVGQGKHKT